MKFEIIPFSIIYCLTLMYKKNLSPIVLFNCYFRIFNSIYKLINIAMDIYRYNK